jgi:hypothetical protein
VVDVTHATPQTEESLLEFAVVLVREVAEEALQQLSLLGGKIRHVVEFVNVAQVGEHLVGRPHVLVEVVKVGEQQLSPTVEVVECLVDACALDEALMEFAYFKDKIPQYWADIKSGKRILRRFKTVKMIFADVCKQYGITKVFAHNARFDYRSLNLTQRWLTSSKFRYFFPYGVEIWDTLKMSRKIFGQMPEYDNFCWEHDYLTKRLAKRYTAEIIYRFISGNNNFEEDHTGLEDVLIEKEIAKYCFAVDPEIDGALWSKGV